jgi:glycosyltransferase involved in cell wall biosynthesis
MEQSGFEVIAISAEGTEVKTIVEAEGVKHITLPLTRTISPLSDLKALVMLIRIMRACQPTIVHTHTPKAGLIGMMAAFFCSVPVRLHTVAGLPLMEAAGLKRRILIMTEKITYWCSHFIFPNSSGLSDFLISRLGFSPLKIKMIGLGSSNGIDVNYFSRNQAMEDQAKHIRSQHGIRPNDIVFSFVGRVVKDKGVVELVTAFKALQKEKLWNDQRIFLLIVGPFEQTLDPLPDDVLEFLNENKEIVLAGFQNDVRPWILASDIFIFPSYREGFPNVVMQASLLKIPSIVSDINGCNEIIKHQETGLIVPPKNVSLLTEAMRLLMSDPAKRRDFAERAYKFVSLNFDQAYIWEELRKIYQRLIHEKKCNPE